MRTNSFRILAALILCMTVGSQSKISDADPAAEEGEGPRPTRALSLRVLQERLAVCESEGSCPDELLQLAGLTRLMGYMVDDDNRDIVFLGAVEPGRPALHLEDLVVALRSAWLRYAQRKRRSIYYTPPGCSIDPDPSVLRRLQRVGSEALGQSSNGEVDPGLDRWRRTCELPQKVRILGVPDSRFSGVMVTADYDLKHLVDGATMVPVSGVTSLTGLALEEAKQKVMAGMPVSMSFSMNRFWFAAGESRFTEADGIVLIEQLPVLLLTEEELVRVTGAVLGSGRPDPMAQRFAKDFTKHFAEIADARPIYAELENLYRFVALVKAIEFRRAHERAGLDLVYLLDTYRLPGVDVADELPGRAHVAGFTYREDLPRGYREIKLLLPSCGGVEINVKLQSANFTAPASGTLTLTRREAVRVRPSPRALYWDL